MMTRKQLAISQAIIQAARPRTCVMPLLFGMGVELHHKYAVTGCSPVGAL